MSADYEKIINLGDFLNSPREQTETDEEALQSNEPGHVINLADHVSGQWEDLERASLLAQRAGDFELSRKLHEKGTHYYNIERAKSDGRIRKTMDRILGRGDPES